MCKSKLDQCRDGKDYIRYVTTHGGVVVKQEGSHVMIKLPNGHTEPVPNHNKDLGKGLRRKLEKIFVAAGITVLLWFWLTAPVFAR